MSKKGPKKIAAVLATGSLVLGSLVTMGAAEAPPTLDYEALGSGADVRAQVMDDQLDGALAAGQSYRYRPVASHNGNGEGSCGEGTCGGRPNRSRGSGRRSAQGGCGQGSCGQGSCGGDRRGPGRRGGRVYHRGAQGHCGGEGHCGEARCGEGRCGEKGNQGSCGAMQPQPPYENGSARAVNTPLRSQNKKSSKKSTEGKCGEGTCG